VPGRASLIELTVAAPSRLRMRRERWTRQLPAAPSSFPRKQEPRADEQPCDDPPPVIPAKAGTQPEQTTLRSPLRHPRGSGGPATFAILLVKESGIPDFAGMTRLA
jgi:hypothetical protein